MKLGELESEFADLNGWQAESDVAILLSGLGVDISYHECIYDYKCDIELRRRILQLVALKLLYSDRTIPERGYKRAIRFINEFNKKLELNLSTDEIDEAINRDYTNGEKWEHVLKTYIDEDGIEHSFWTIENIAKKEKKSLGKINKLVKSLLKK